MDYGNHVASIKRAMEEKYTCILASIPMDNTGSIYRRHSRSRQCISYIRKAKDAFHGRIIRSFAYRVHYLDQDAYKDSDGRYIEGESKPLGKR